jgi:BirA family transcriptional regulator, biotin operon repressor / biotin---[acetyl-CoA-carboxylase] ligase
MIDSEVLESALSRTKGVWRNECVDCIESTNSELSSRYSDSTHAPFLLLWSEEQTMGRGRLDRVWHSVPGLDITASLIFPAHVKGSDLPKLSICAGLALTNILNRNYHLPTQIKWPNDVVTSNGKLAGILANYLSAPDAVIIGIGINVNSGPEFPRPDFLLPPTSIYKELRHTIPREPLLASWVIELESLWHLADISNYDALKEAYNSASFYKSRHVRIYRNSAGNRASELPDDFLEGIVGSIDKSGAQIIDIGGQSDYKVSTDDVLICVD